MTISNSSQVETIKELQCRLASKNLQTSTAIDWETLGQLEGTIRTQSLTIKFIYKLPSLLSEAQRTHIYGEFRRLLDLFIDSQNSTGKARV